MSLLTDLLGGNDAEWMANPDRPCAQPNTRNLTGSERRHLGLKIDVNWYPRTENVRGARAACAGCPIDVKNACLAYALENKEEGYWGGTTTDERARMRSKAAKAGAA